MGLDVNEYEYSRVAECIPADLGPISLISHHAGGAEQDRTLPQLAMASRAHLASCWCECLGVSCRVSVHWNGLKAFAGDSRPRLCQAPIAHTQLPEQQLLYNKRCGWFFARVPDRKHAKDQQ